MQMLIPVVDILDKVELVIRAAPLNYGMRQDYLNALEVARHLCDLNNAEIEVESGDDE